MGYDVRKVSRLTDISVDTVHHYVKKFREYFPGLKRGRFNRLVFSEEDVNFLVHIRTLNKVENLTLKEIKTKFREEGVDLSEMPAEEKKENNPEKKQVEYPIEKFEEFHNMLSTISDEYKALTENNAKVLEQNDDMKKMMNVLYTKLSHIELRQKKIIDDMNVGFWDRFKDLMLKPVRVPFLWKL
jgi:DNA-binding transcriptional MerR regulator